MAIKQNLGLRKTIHVSYHTVDSGNDVANTGMNMWITEPKHVMKHDNVVNIT